VAAPAATEPPRDSELIVRLEARRRQRLAPKRRVVATVTCPAEACTISAGAAIRGRRGATTIEPIERSLAPGESHKLRLRLSKKAVRGLRAARRSGKRPAVRVTVRATDAAGNVAVKRLSISAR
jgi:hypothetical protein